MKKRSILCMLLCFCMLLCLLPCYSQVHADNEVILLVINNTVIRPLVNQIIPIRIDDGIYMPYEMLNNLTSVKFYNSDELGQIVIYNSQKKFTFDLANNRAFDLSGKSYSQVAKQIGDLIYIPFDVVCKYFEIYSSLTEYTDIAPVFRINEGELIVSDQEFSKQLNSLLKSTYDAYISSGENDTPIIPEEPDTPVLSKKLGHIFFEGIDIASVSAMGSDTVFFLTELDIEHNDELIRKAISKGQEIGFLLDPESGITLAEQFIHLNKRLNLKACYTAHLVSIKGGSENMDPAAIEELILCGARIWDSNLSFDPSDEKAVDGLISSISDLDTTAVISLTASEKTVNLLPSLYKALNDINLSLLPIKLWTAPINQINDIR